jgi:HEXXH motif-containing protein
LGILGQAWPAALDELKQGVKQIVFFRSHKIIGFADIHTHGAIFLRHETIADPVRLAEEILHESSHVRMNATLACQDYYVDDGRLFESPLRRDARPIFGLLHQLFVLRRLMSFYERIRSGVHQHRLELIQSHFKAAFKTIHSEAKLTSKGMDFLKSMEI